MSTRVIESSSGSGVVSDSVQEVARGAYSFTVWQEMIDVTGLNGVREEIPGLTSGQGRFVAESGSIPLQPEDLVLHLKDGRHVKILVHHAGLLTGRYDFLINGPIEQDQGGI